MSPVTMPGAPLAPSHKTADGYGGAAGRIGAPGGGGGVGTGASKANPCCCKRVVCVMGTQVPLAPLASEHVT